MHSCVRADVHVLQGNTPLLLAVHRNQPKIVAVLLSTRSPNINATDKEVHAFLVTSPGSKPPVSMHRMSTSLQSYGFYRSGCCPLKSSGNHSHTALLEKQCRLFQSALWLVTITSCNLNRTGTCSKVACGLPAAYGRYSLEQASQLFSAHQCQLCMSDCHTDTSPGACSGEKCVAYGCGVWQQGHGKTVAGPWS